MCPVWQKRCQSSRSVVLLGSTTSLPGDVAELHSNALRHAPLLGEHAPVLLLIVHQLTFDPRVAPVYLIQPGNLRRRTPPLTAAAVNNSRSAQIHARLKISSCTKVLLKTQPNDNPFCPTIRFVSLRGSRGMRMLELLEHNCGVVLLHTSKGVLATCTGWNVSTIRTRSWKISYKDWSVSWSPPPPFSSS